MTALPSSGEASWGVRLFDRQVGRRRWLVFVLAVAADATFLIPLSFVKDQRYVLGIPGSLVALVAVVAGALAGPVLGAAVGFAGGIIFFVTVAGMGAHSSLPTALVSTAIWCAGAVISGLTADALRDQIRRRRETAVSLAQAETIRETVEAIVGVAPRLHGADSVDEVAREVCLSAMTMFGPESVAVYTKEDGTLRLVAAVPAVPGLDPEARISVGEAPSLWRLTELRQPTFIAAAPVDALLRIDPRTDPAASLRPMVAVPVRTGEALYGLLVATWRRGVEPPDERRLATMQRFTDQAAIALLEATRRQAESLVNGLHASLEASLLPRLPVRHPRLHIATLYQPGERRLLLGGDFFAMLTLDDGRLAIAIGDVMGHSPEAAALGATLRASWRALTLSGATALTTLNSLAELVALDGAASDLFATVCLAWIDPEARVATLFSAGHPPPVLLHDEVTLVDAAINPALGVTSTSSWEPTVLKLPTDWGLVFYTDGLIEGRAAPAGSERFGEERLVAWLREEAPRPIDQRALDALVDDVRMAHGGPLTDDVAVVAISSLPEGESEE